MLGCLTPLVLTPIPWQEAGALSGTQHQLLIFAISHSIGALLCIDIAARKNRHLVAWGGVGLAVGPLAALVLMVLPPLQGEQTQHHDNPSP